MKQALPTKAALCSFVFTIISLVSVNPVAAQKSDLDKVQETGNCCFIQLKDGTIRQYTSLKLVTGVLITPHLVADNGDIFKASDIKAYQNDKHFAVSYSSLNTSKSALVSVETLPGFAVRVVNGKINVYTRKYFNGNTTANEYFLQNGTDGDIVTYSPALLKSFVKENSKALDYYNSNVKVSPKSKKLLTTAEIYNTGELFSKN